MKLRPLLLLPLLAATPLHASQDAAATPTPGILGRMTDRTLEVLHLKHAPKQTNAPQMHHQLELRIDVAPAPVKLSDTREMKVTVSVFNRGKKFVHLDFPTSQRIEVLVRDPSGKAVTTWSEDQSFTNDPATVTVNPGERLEYAVTVATREMNAGQPYTVEASFPAYPELTIRQQVIPQK